MGRRGPLRRGRGESGSGTEKVDWDRDRQSQEGRWNWFKVSGGGGRGCKAGTIVNTSILYMGKLRHGARLTTSLYSNRRQVWQTIGD